MSLTDRITYTHHPDDAYIDEVRISIKPRYKTSGLSGDEWRISAQVQLLRKGHVVLTEGYRDVEVAAAALPWLLMTASEREDFQRLPDDIEHSLCFQPGCSEPATTVYELKKEYCRSCASPQADNKHGREPLYAHTRRAYCARHARRGDCAFEDADANYTVVSGDGPNGSKMQISDESPSINGGVVTVGSVDEIPAALDAKLKELRSKGDA